jgi:hypothetical protein
VRGRSPTHTSLTSSTTRRNSIEKPDLHITIGKKRHDLPIAVAEEGAAEKCEAQAPQSATCRCRSRHHCRTPFSIHGWLILLSFFCQLGCKDTIQAFGPPRQLSACGRPLNPRQREPLSPPLWLQLRPSLPSTTAEPRLLPLRLMLAPYV